MTQMLENEVIIFKAETTERLDKQFKSDLLSRSALQNLMSEGLVTCGGKAVSKNFKPKIGDIIEIEIPAPTDIDILPENIPLDIRYEDSDLLIVNKPKGMVVHPAPGNYTGTLVNALMYHCKDSLSGINGVIRPGIVHRIDQDTSGLLVVAKNDNAHVKLSEQIKEHSCLREYQSIVYGNVKDDAGTVNAPIGRDSLDRKKMSVTHAVSHTREAITHYEVIERLSKGFTHMKFRLETGRTHQIRVHMAYIGHPVAGDPVYGPKKVITELQGQCLHACLLGFIHPVSGKLIEVRSELPEYFTDFLKKCN